MKYPLLIMDRKTRQKARKEIEDLSNAINELDLTDNCRALHTTTEYTFFSSAQGTFSKIDHM